MVKINDNYIKDLIKNSKNKVIGLRQVLKKILEDAVECVIVSIDADEFVLNTIRDKIKKDKKITIYKALKSAQIGEICNIDVPCSVVGLLSKN